jgi:two-component system sensor kinase FixL
VVEEAIALGTAGAVYNDTRVNVELDARVPLVMVNKVQIQQVLVNLCRNAFEAMKSARRRVLTVGTRLETPETVMITVSDTGPGIAPEVMERLFQPFTTTKSEGMGIGLKICQSIVEAHGGQIWITPNEDEGVTFRVRLPIDEDEEI